MMLQELEIGRGPMRDGRQDSVQKVLKMHVLHGLSEGDRAHPAAVRQELQVQLPAGCSVAGVILAQRTPKEQGVPCKNPLQLSRLSQQFIASPSIDCTPPKRSITNCI